MSKAKKGKKEDISFETAYQELSALAAQLQSGDVGIDQLSKSVARANELVTFCKGRLRDVEVELQTLFDEDNSDS